MFMLKTHTTSTPNPFSLFRDAKKMKKKNGGEICFFPPPHLLPTVPLT